MFVYKEGANVWFIGVDTVSIYKKRGNQLFVRIIIESEGKNEGFIRVICVYIKGGGKLMINWS